MLVITIYKMSNASRWYPFAKSHQDHQGSQREQLRTLVALRRRLCLQQPAPACGLTHGCVTMLSDSQGCELSSFVLIL